MEQDEIENYVKAGEIAKEVKEFVRGLIKPGMLLIDIANAIDNKISELGAEPAFPVNLSLNEVAAHYTPAPGDTTVAEGILKIDIGVAIDGYIADTAFSVDLTEDGEFKEMMELNEEILAAATDAVKVGMEVRDIGNACQDTLEEFNEKNDSSYSIIKTLSGHALGKGDIHAGLTISNYSNENRTKLDDSAFAVEPFVTTGVGDIYEGPVGGIYVVQSDGRPRDPEARILLEHIKENFGTLPFCLRWLEDKVERIGGHFTVSRLKLLLSGMIRYGILHHYPQLIEKSRKPVSQFENTFIISNGEVINTTKE